MGPIKDKTGPEWGGPDSLTINGIEYVRKTRRTAGDPGEWVYLYGFGKGGPVYVNGERYVKEPTRGYGPIPDTVIRWRVADPGHRIDYHKFYRWVRAGDVRAPHTPLITDINRPVRDLEKGCVSEGWVLYIGEAVE